MENMIKFKGESSHNIKSDSLRRSLYLSDWQGFQNHENLHFDPHGKYDQMLHFVLGFLTFPPQMEWYLNAQRFYLANISTSHQRCFKVVDQRWNSVESTLKMKQNPTSDFQHYKTLIQRQSPTLQQRRSNVVQRYYSVVSTLFKRSLNVVKARSEAMGLLISMGL